MSIDEAGRIVGNLCRNPHWNGTTTPEIVDEICERFSLFIFCNGYGRNIIFTPVTKNTIAYKTVAFK